jgi:hypothetical protein
MHSVVKPAMMDTPVTPNVAPEAWAARFTESLRAGRNRVGASLAAHRQRLEEAVALVEGQLERLEEQHTAEHGETDLLRAARDALTVRLAQAEAQLADVERRLAEQSDSAAGRAADEDLQRRLESALADLHEARNKNGELQQQLAKARSTAAKTSQQGPKTGRLDWESEKKRILEALEADGAAADEAQETERLGIVEVLRTTDEVIAAKDREIRELKRRLEEAAGRIAANVPDATPVEQILNKDAIVQEERRRLEQLQQECRNKLRQAEVELAVERAKMARQRAEIEEHRHAAETPPMLPAAQDGDDSADRSSRRRWMARLGLTAADIEPNRHQP